MIRRDIWPLPKPAPVPYGEPDTDAQFLAPRHLEFVANGHEAGIAAPWSTETRSDLSALPDTSKIRNAAPAKPFSLAGLPWLVLILAVQAVLSLRLVRLDTAFSDEALYLWAGHQEWARLIHGTPVPPFATYLSGSPVIYPPLAALADSIGGLVGARILSLFFMLGSTVLLWSTATRLYGKKTAFFSAAMWALLGETLRLGAFATYDSMACFLLALAAWCAVRSGQSDNGAPWAMLAAVVLALANCAKYATAIFDPTVVLLVVVVGLTRSLPRKELARRGAVVSAYTVICLVGLLTLSTIDNQYYITGIAATTLSRPPGGASAISIIQTFWPYLKILAPTAVVGGIVCFVVSRKLSDRLLVLLLLATGVVAPLNQIRIHTATSLGKHEDFAAWFVAIAAGYGLSVLMSGSLMRRGVALAAGLGAIAGTAVIGLPTAKIGDDYWSNTTQVVSVVRPLVASTDGEILFQNPSILDYYLGSEYGWGSIWKRISGQNSLRLPSGRTIDVSPIGGDGIIGPYIAAVKNGYFKVIALNDYLKDSANSFDAGLIPVVERDKNYKLIGHPGAFFVWKYEPHTVMHAKGEK
jgi:4-amino-4-deoxy-L-arabinose transferase-like glycosyltransferase